MTLQSQSESDPKPAHGEFTIHCLVLS